MMCVNFVVVESQTLVPVVGYTVAVVLNWPMLDVPKPVDLVEPMW